MSRLAGTGFERATYPQSNTSKQVLTAAATLVTQRNSAHITHQVVDTMQGSPPLPSANLQFTPTKLSSNASHAGFTASPVQFLNHITNSGTVTEDLAIPAESPFSTVSTQPRLNDLMEANGVIC
ncbi:hypothetical protein PABG_11942 [Paracoccidioides brasiliensis Pb03]|nr:hypothetical protein PABG_11942 [Paracoccidioides brasiliensis Pb03]